jgi:hypothetical protein
VETLALKLRPKLPESWVVASGRSMPPFVIILFVFSGGLALAQLLANRSILHKAHLRTSPNVRFPRNVFSITCRAPTRSPVAKLPKTFQAFKKYHRSLYDVADGG